MLSKLQASVATKRQTVETTLPYELQERSGKIENVKRVLQGPAVGDKEIKELEYNIRRLTQELTTLEETQQRPQKGSAEEKLQMYKQQARMVAKKKEKLLKKQANLLEDKAEGIAELEPYPALPDTIAGPA